MLTGIALAVGIASVVALLGISQSSAAQTVARLNDLSPDSIQVTLSTQAWDRSDDVINKSIADIPGIIAAGTFTPVESASATFALSTPFGEKATVPAIVATTSGMLARNATVISGALLDDFIAANDPSSIVIGASLAKRMGITAEEGSNLIVINNRHFVVTALIHDSAGNSLVSTSLLLSPRAAQTLGVLPLKQIVYVRTAEEQAAVVAPSLPLSIAPTAPDDIQLTVPPSTEQLRNRIAEDLNGLVYAIALVTIFTSLVGILNTMQTAVFERRSEIGILKAMGLSRRGIGLQFLFESAIVGASAGLIGFVGGVLIGAVTSLLSGWIYYLPLIAVIAPLLGVLVGLLAGTWPAWRASRTDASELIRAA
ncbi:MAG: ABC transporter permease [Microbacteriaceae bacterium]